MKDNLKEVLTSPPVILAVILAVYTLISPVISPLFSHPAEKMSVSTFMKYHSVEELARYWRLNGDTGYAADVINEYYNGEYYFISEEEARHMVDSAYAHGYLDGATGQYDGLEGAVEAGDIPAICEYTGGVLHPSDFLE